MKVNLPFLSPVMGLLLLGGGVWLATPASAEWVTEGTAAVVLEPSTVRMLPDVGAPFRAIIPVGERFAVQAGDNIVALVNPQFARIEWLHSTQGQIRHFGLDKFGHLVVAAQDLVAFDPRSGVVMWFLPLTSQSLWYIDDEIAVLSGFGPDQQEVEVNIVQLEDGRMMWPAWARVPAVQRVEVDAKTIWVFPDDRPGWVYPLPRQLGRNPGLKAVSLKVLPKAPRKVWDKAVEGGKTFVYQPGRGAVVDTGPVDFVIEYEGELYVLSHDTVHSFEPRSTKEAMDNCADAGFGAEQAKCLETNLVLTTYMGAGGEGFDAAIAALLEAKDRGEVTRYKAVATLQAMAVQFPRMNAAEQMKATDRMLRYADTLSAQGAHLEAYKLYTALRPFAQGPTIPLAADRERCLLLGGGERCVPPVR